MERAIIAGLVIVGLFLLVVVSYKLNKATPVPEGCENLVPDCKACGMKDCSLREGMLQKIEEEEKKHGNR